MDACKYEVRAINNCIFLYLNKEGNVDIAEWFFLHWSTSVIDTYNNIEERISCSRVFST